MNILNQDEKYVFCELVLDVSLQIRNSAKRKAPQDEKFAVCPLCKVSLKRTNLEEHMVSKCPKRAGESSTSTKEAGRKAGSKAANVPWTVCKWCGEFVDCVNLQEHKRKKCPRRHGRPTVNHFPGGPQADREDLFHGSDPRDGSKYLGWMARENGQFGSYPMHDAYGEESGPD
jgi:hypothetical protein